MKDIHPVFAVKKIAPLLALLLTPAGVAGAQTITQTYADYGSPTASLGAISFDSYQYSSYSDGTSAYDTTGTEIGAQGGNAFGVSWTAMNYTFGTPAAPVGYALTAVDLTLYVVAGGPETTSTYTVYNGFDRTLNAASTFDVTIPADIGTYKTISIPTTAVAGGFSIGYAPNSSIMPSFNTKTEGFNDVNQRPAVTFTFTAIPEPSIALLAPLGLVLAGRRRRSLSVPSSSLA